MNFRLLMDDASAGVGRSRRTLWLGDLSGGLIAALVALPYGLAMAALMGLPPVTGIFSSIVCAPFLAFLGRDPLLVGGASSVTVPFVAQATRLHGPQGAALLILMAALIMVLFSVVRLGRHILRVPHAVVSGFTCGIGGLMIVSQLHTLLGLQAPADTAFASAAQTLISVSCHLQEARLAPLIIGMTTMLIALLGTRISPYMPAPLLGVLAAVGISFALGAHEKEVGALPVGLPSLFGAQWSFELILQLFPSACALAFVCAVNILMTARVVEHFRGHHGRMKPADADAELRAFGIANCFAGLVGAPPSVGMPARSIAVIKCGGTTRMANLIHAAALVLILWLGSALVSHIPLAALAGVTLWLSLGLFHFSTWLRLPKMRRTDAAAFVCTAIAVLVVSSAVALLIGCALYLIPRFLGLQIPTAPASTPDETSPDEEAELVDSAAD